MKESKGERAGLLDALKAGDRDNPGVDVPVPFPGVPEVECE